MIVDKFSMKLFNAFSMKNVAKRAITVEERVLNKINGTVSLTKIKDVLKMPAKYECDEILKG